jgi:type II secretory pathway predicted ATPase ExeA
MFENHFKFIRKPFQKDISPGALLETRTLKNLQNRLLYGVDNRFFIVLTGDSGSGKTTAVRQFVSSLDLSQKLVLYVSEFNLTPRNFYFDLLDQMGIKPRFFRGDAKRQFTTAIKELVNRLPIIIIDEAHLCNMEMLTEIRFLLNFNMDSESPMSLILVGQTELRDTLQKAVYEAISQRINLRCHVQALDRVETESYIIAHLNYAGTKEIIFTDKAITAIYEYSRGLPRKINNVALFGLAHAAESNKSYVDDSMILAVIKEELDTRRS